MVFHNRNGDFIALAYVCRAIAIRDKVQRFARIPRKNSSKRIDSKIGRVLREAMTRAINCKCCNKTLLATSNFIVYIFIGFLQK